MEGVSSELGPLEYLSGLLNKPMDQIINWFILIIIFVFDPLAVALVIAFNNAVLVDRGIVKKEKVIRKRELYDEIPDDEDDDSGDDSWDDTLEDELEEDSWEERIEEPIEDIEVESEAVTVENEFDERDLNKDGIVDEEEELISYENGGWRSSYNGNPFYTHPWFDWNRKERWINDRKAINFWMQNKGGSQGQLDAIKKEKYPDDFTSKTY
jgi:hypothetical protein